MTTFKPSNNHNKPVDDLGRFYSHDKARCFLWFLILGCLAVVLSMIYIPAQAANSATNDEQNSSAPSEADNQSRDKPEGLIDYIAQEIEVATEDGIGFSDIKEEWLNASEQKSSQRKESLQGDTRLTGEYNESYYVLDALNTGLPPLAKPPNLSTPLATLAFFQSAVMQQQFDLAAYALNMNLLDEQIQINRSIELSRRLDFLLTKKKLYVFNELPDRPDGLIEPPIGSTSNIMGVPRRSIQLGYLDYRERRVPIFMERVRVDDTAPIWVFSAQTVSHIDALYEQYQPAKFERYLPDWLMMRFLGIALWEFLALALFFFLTMGIGWLLSLGAGKLIGWYIKDDNQIPYAGGHNSVTDLVDKLTVPLTFTISFSLVFTLVSGGFPYFEAVATATRPIVWIGLVISAVWLGIRSINFFANRYHDFQIDNLGEEQFDKERRRRTYVSVFRRVFIFVMIIGSFWIGLSEFTNIEGLGKTLLTSAGIAGAVIGIAAQPILGNTIAGMQVAITQPVRIGDTVMMEGEWTTIEDLGYTYAVLKTWDQRRLIVPMRHFVTETIENWSHTDEHQTCVVHLYVDYGADIDAIRQKYISIVEGNELWDKDFDPSLLVVGVTEHTIKLRGDLASDGPNNAFALECAVREQMLAYLHHEQKAYLPTERITFKET